MIIYKIVFFQTVSSFTMSFSIPSRFQSIFNSFKNKTIKQFEDINPWKKINNIIDYPATWLKSFQRIWLTTLICLSIICCCLVIFYCLCQGYFRCRCRRKQTKLCNRDLVKLSTIMKQNKY